MPITASPFRPHPLLANPHVQTIWPSLIKQRPTFDRSDERLELPDGDFLDLVWSTNTSDSLVLFLHGLEGNLQSHYAPSLIRALVAAGHRVVFMHFRGCSGVTNRLARAYHSGDTGDIRYVVNHLREREQPGRFSALGVSLGGNALLKYLGEEKEETPLDQAIAISVPFDLATAAETLMHGPARIYQRHLLDKLKASTRRKLVHHRLPVDADELERIDTIYAFDDQITAPVHGFEGADHYYRESSSRQFLTDVRVPTTILHARDDPFMTPEVIPRDEDLSDAVELVLSAKGGHVGFIGREGYWLDTEVPRILGIGAPA